MQYLTYPFHSQQQATAAFPSPAAIDDGSPSNARRRSTTSSNSSNTGTSNHHLLAVPETDNSRINTSKGSLDTTPISTGCSPVSLYKLPSNQSTTSSQLIQSNNAAFNKLRTAFQGAADQQGGTARDGDQDNDVVIPELPSLTKGHWRSFGPTEALLTAVSTSSLGSEVFADHKKWGKRVRADKFPSTAWRGTIWLTETHLLFVQDPDTLLEVQNPTESQCEDPNYAGGDIRTTNWIAALREALGSKKASRGSTDTQQIPAETKFGATQCPRTGRSYTACRIPLTSLKKVSHSKDTGTKGKKGTRRGGKSIGRTSEAISSTQNPLSRTGTLSVTASPALSRSQTRHSEGKGGTSETHAFYLGQAPGRNEDGPPVDFAQLINKKDHPYKVTVLSDDQDRCARIELRFMSSLYAQEARDLADRLQAHVKKGKK